MELLSITFIGIFIYIYFVDILQKSDPLTGLLNRGSYINKLSSLASKVAIVYFDVDEFKSVNDKYGHLYGDKVLHNVGQLIKDVYAKYGSCYRIGGDEFCVVLEKQDGIPYETAKMGIVSEDTVEEYIRIHEKMLQGAEKANGIVKLIQADGTVSTQKLSFYAVYDEDGKPTGNAVGVYSVVQNEEESAK